MSCEKSLIEDNPYPNAHIRLGDSLIYVCDRDNWLPIHADSIEYAVLRDTKRAPMHGYCAFKLKNENRSLWVCMDDSGIMPEELAKCLGMEICPGPETSPKEIHLRRKVNA